MAVAHDAASESADSQSEPTFSWTHTPTGTPRGALVFVISSGNAATSPLETGVTYGGSAMTAVSGGAATDGSGEIGSCQAWFLGASVPTGGQTVEVSRPSTASIMWACAITVTADTDTEVAGVVLEQTDQALTEQNVDDGSPGTNSVRYMGLFSGLANPTTNITDGANSTRLHDTNLIASGRCAVAMRETTAGQGSRPVGVTAASDDVAAVYLAIREVSGGGGFTGASRIFGGWSSPLTGTVIH